MAVNYNDARFQEVERQKNQALSETKGTYDQMINNSESYYQQQIDASKDWANKQNELQQAQTDFTIEKINQAKDQAKKDYTKEQKGAYTDYQKATGQYSANAETLAVQGLNQAGYSESVRTNMYNTYQNRYASARESYNQAILNYDNSIKEAQLANNSALAKIAYEALQQQLELSLQGFQYKNQLILQKLDAVNETEDRYYKRYQDVLSQINTENALAEQIRQFNAKMAFEREQFAWTKAQAAAKSSGGSGGSRSSGSSKSSGSSSGSATLKSGSSGSSNISNSSKSKTTTLSKNGQALATFVSRSVAMKNYDTARDLIYNQVVNNKISKSDANLIFNRYGL